MKIDAHGLIYDARNRLPRERIAFFTTLCLLRRGHILAGFQIGSQKHAPDGTIRLCRSTDGARSWREIPFQFETTQDGIPGSLAAVEMVEVRAGRLLLFTTWFDRTDPNRPLFDPVSEGILHSRQLMAVSTDDGETWSPWRELPTAGLTGCATTGPILSWADGTIAYAFESFKEFDDPRPGRHAAWLLVSRDGGDSFDPPILVAQHPEHTLYYWDQRLCPTNQLYELIGLFWTHDLAAKRDRNVHFLKTSLDFVYRPAEGAGASSWAVNENPRLRRERESAAARLANGLPVETMIPGQIAAPLYLDDHTLLAFVVNRDVPGTMTLWRSLDGGKSWPVESRLVVHQHIEHAALTQGRENIDFKAYWEDMGKWSFGHPAIKRLSDSHVLVAYYAGTPDTMSIHWARVEI